jgi:hypothetical protein
MNPDGGASSRRFIAKPALDINASALNRLNLFEETPHADPLVGCCGSWGGKPSGDPIRLNLAKSDQLLRSTKSSGFTTRAIMSSKV